MLYHQFFALPNAFPNPSARGTCAQIEKHVRAHAFTLETSTLSLKSTSSKSENLTSMFFIGIFSDHMRPVPRHHTMRGRGTRSRRNAERGPSFTLFCVLDLDFCMHSRTATRYFTVCEMSTPPHSTHEHTRLGALSDTDTPLTPL